MNISEQSRSAIVSLLNEAISKYKLGEGKSVVTDIHLQPRQDSGELVVYNDDDEKIGSSLIPEWVGYDGADFCEEVEPILREILQSMKEKDAFKDVSLMRPYSFVLVDYDKETIAELIIVDDEDTLLLSGELLKGLDEELDVFLKELLEK